MVRKRFTPPDEFTRFAENLWNFSGQNIKDRDSYDAAFDKYMRGEEVTGRMNTVLRDKAFDYLVDKAGVSRERLFTSAGGKNLLKDQNIKAKTTVTSEVEYRKRGARRVDLKGYDTPQFTLPGKRGRRFVFAREENIMVRGKSQVRYRDKKGVFVSVKKRE